MLFFPPPAFIKTVHLQALFIYLSVLMRCTKPLENISSLIFLYLKLLYLIFPLFWKASSIHLKLGMSELLNSN